MPDLSDPWVAIRELQAEVRRLRSGIPLENSSITNGRMRFIGGLLRVDSGGSVQIVGTLSIDGTTTVTGSFTVTGPWGLEGDGTITGDVTISGNVTSTGIFTQNGPWALNGAGDITGNVDLTGSLLVQSAGEVRVNGSNPIRLRQNGTLAQIELGSTGVIRSGGDGLTLASGLSYVNVYSGGVEMGGIGKTMQIGGASVVMPSLPTANNLDGLSWVAVDATGKLWKVPPGIGGPGTGEFDWPFALSMVTSEYGMRIHPVTGVETMHNGIDFGASSETPIKAAGGGTVSAVAFSSGPGNYVDIDHGSGIETRYFHMFELSSLTVGQSVSKGDVIGLVGSTGSSTGAHLHFETHVNGSPINPRDFMAAHNADDGVA